MTDQSQESLKVYELAKELGLDSFTLLDKLKSINIEVKSHMSSLAAEQAQAIRDALKPGKKPAGATTVKKRSSSSASTAAASTTAASGATAAPAPKQVAKKAAAEPAAAASASKTQAEPAAAAGGARKVIKRRT
ncbi:MAG: translation initiation factor IF-2 N-terminal domain-containing protein, partial [Bdellovibrionota bacterium]